MAVRWRRYTVLLAAFTTACVSLHRGPRTELERREIAVYRAVAESLYLPSAANRSIALVTQVLDTACSIPECPSLERRWGLDSLWWSGDDRAGPAALKDALLAQAGQQLAFGPRGIGNSRIVPVDRDAIPGLAADTATWAAFQAETGAVAALRFAPAGFSRDGRRALVVTRMVCGPQCGHWLGASLVQRNGAWSIADVLLISSDRPTPVRRPPPPGETRHARQSTSPSTGTSTSRAGMQ